MIVVTVIELHYEIVASVSYRYYFVETDLFATASIDQTIKLWCEPNINDNSNNNGNDSDSNTNNRYNFAW